MFGERTGIILSVEKRDGIVFLRREEKLVFLSEERTYILLVGGYDRHNLVSVHIKSLTSP